jgi:two-component system NtrC family sensor kinase
MAALWEVFSALLFISAVVPAAFETPWPAVVLLGSLGLSAALAHRLKALGMRGYTIAGALRALSWPLAAGPSGDPADGRRHAARGLPAPARRARRRAR